MIYGINSIMPHPLRKKAYKQVSTLCTNNLNIE
jgi:hypothetical protein